MTEKLIIRGAREHNLKNIDLELPKNSLIVFTGISGSGKSSLAFDTIYAEGQRRYVESLSAYARQFLGLMEKPDVDQIQGLSPAISIDQKSASRNPRSTVGTVTEIYDYMRLLWARVGQTNCPNCGTLIKSQTVQEIVDLAYTEVDKAKKDSKILILAPVIKGRKGIYENVFEDLKRKGFVRVRVDKNIYEIEEAPTLDRYKIHNIDIVIDRLVSPVEKQRITESVEQGLKSGEGLVIINIDGQDHLFSERLSCSNCGTSLPEIEPRTFSFNSPQGACTGCSGLGFRMEFDPILIIPNKGLSISEGGVLPWNRILSHDSWTTKRIEALSQRLDFSLSTPLKDLKAEVLEAILYGSDNSFRVTGRNRFGRTVSFNTNFEGLIPELERRYKETESDWTRRELEKYMREEKCSLCLGSRLKKEALSVTINSKNIAQVCEFSINETLIWFEKLDLTPNQKLIAKQILKEINLRLKFLNDVGLSYLTINRNSVSLAGGEAQRIRLASQIGSGLSGVLYVLDEPSIGLHQKDNEKLIQTLKELKELGNTVIVVEHDADTINSADYVVDIGPGAGEHGGKVIAVGTPQEIQKNALSITGQYLSGKKEISKKNFNGHTRSNEETLNLKGVKEHNLKNVSVSIPLGKFVCITGVSGSGKSTLVEDVLFRALAAHFYQSKDRPGEFESLEGLENIDKVVDIDQSPIGRTPRSNPATYTGAFSYIRELFAKTQEARSRGYSSGRFSFNVKGGRCENCQGDGVIKIEMQFLPDVYVTCEVCNGHRYNREALEILYKGKNISEVLNMTVEEAHDFFTNIPAIKSKLGTLNDVGLGYIRLGQPATTLSGGEAQRVKLATELSKRSTGKTFYILDEPTTGLHFQDVENLLYVLHKLVDLGNTVLIIEHNLDVIKTSDWIIDLGPDGGQGGGEVIATGTPEQVAAVKKSYTGQFLKTVLSPLKGLSSRAKRGDLDI